jgi:hypothetical protein
MEEDRMITRYTMTSISLGSMVASLGLMSGCAMEMGTGDATEVAEGTQEIRGHHRPDFRILGPGGKIRGKTYEQWSGAWWSWLYSIPASTNPALDATGEFCQEGQQGPVFNLAGTFGGSANRTCTIRHGKPVFFPIITLAADNCGVPPQDQLSIEQILAIQENYPNTVTSVTLEVDGVVIGDDKDELASFLTDTTEFSYVVPAEDSLYDLMGSDFEGACAPSFVRGYFVMLQLDRGQHTIHFTGAQDNGFAIDTTYQLTVR